MNKKVFQGIMPALVTPFDSEGKLKRKTVGELINWQLSKGVQGFYICGNTGEGPVLPEQTRMEMAEAAVEAVNGRGVVIDHVMAADFRQTVRLAKHAEKAGADAISSLTPTYFFGQNEDEIYEYYKALAGAVNIPLIAYVTPQMGAVRLPALAERLLKIDNIIGFKFTRPSYFELFSLTQVHGGNINVLNGPDETLLCGLVMGADGGIGSTYNLMAEGFVSLYENFRAGRWEAAQRDQYAINRVIEVLLRHDALNCEKFVLRLLGFDVGESAFPRRRYAPEEQSAIRSELAEAGFFAQFAKDRQ